MFSAFMKLKDEINANEGSFLLELRTEYTWNHNAFIRLLSLIHEEHLNTKDNQELSRELAFGIWFLYESSRDYILNLTQSEIDKK